MYCFTYMQVLVLCPSIAIHSCSKHFFAFGLLDSLLIRLLPSFHVLLNVSYCDTGVLHIIPGRGSHSTNQQAKIKPKLIEYLQKNSYRYPLEVTTGSVSWVENPEEGGRRKQTSYLSSTLLLLLPVALALVLALCLVNNLRWLGCLKSSIIFILVLHCYS